ncbi:NADPH dehydrogenase [Macrolepiota fuliginosa MF-IS2]|uniref:NADPH dehydrogenase n=1 Tax=Macrolepiota fuliginosa MF-IS2 TaxID=1400762 RepID=A0A9P6BYY2_9AGAR|nr:NADPH dehydrogenase [Macrolepiota fuliginosa MF-IS2]
MAPNNANVAARGVSYFTPAQNPPAGTATSPQPNGRPVPTIFKPLRIRGVTFQNRIWLSPLCQYSAQDGAMTPWHLAHLGGILTRGPGLTMVEATAVTSNGRITPEDSGIWSQHQLLPLKQVVDFAHSQSQKIGIQLAHAGRKASTVAPWIDGDATASKEIGGWPDDVWGPSAIPFEDSYPKPKELTREAIKVLVNEFAEAAKRAIEVGFDVIEIHNAHGYLLHSFISPISNKRTDEYGGGFENRIRFTLEVVDAVRAVMPESMPLFLRISATDWLEESLPDEPSWRSEDTARIAPILYEHGIDLLDVSSGGNHTKQKVRGGPAYQSPFARDVMKAIGANGAYTPPSEHDGGLNPSARSERLLVTSVGAITSGITAERLLDEGFCDAIVVGRGFLKNPSLVWAWADELATYGLDNPKDDGEGIQIRLANQIRWGFKGRGKRTSDGKEDHGDNGKHDGKSTYGAKV